MKLTEIGTIFPKVSFPPKMANNLMFNPRLDFEDMSCDEEEDNVSEKSGATSSSTNHSSK